MILFSSAFKKSLVVVGVLIVGIISFLWIDSNTSLFSRAGEYAVESDSSHHAEHEIIKPEFLHGMVVNDLHVVEDEVKRNQRFTELLSGPHFSECYATT